MPLLVPAAVAASSKISLTTLFSSALAALGSGLLLGNQLSSKNIPKSRSAPSWLPNVFTEHLEEFKEQLRVELGGILPWKYTSMEELKELTARISAHSNQLSAATHTLRETTAELKKDLHEPLVEVRNALLNAKAKADEVRAELVTTQAQYATANAKLKELNATLSAQQQTIESLQSVITPLTQAVAVQTQEKEKAQRKLHTLIEHAQKQKEALQQALDKQVTLNQQLQERLGSLEEELIQAKEHYQQSVAQKRTVEQLLEGYQKQQITLIDRNKELSDAYEESKRNIGSRGEDDKALVAVKLECEELKKSLAQQKELNEALVETAEYLENHTQFLERSLQQITKEYESTQRNYQEACAAITRLNEEAKEHEALLHEQGTVLDELLSESQSSYEPQFFKGSKVLVSSNDLTQRQNLTY